MPVLYPVVSRLHDRDTVEKIIKIYCKNLQVDCVSDIPREGVVFVLVCTGGTEHLILEAAKINPNIILLAHEEQNSLPAALEALAGLTAMGIPSRVIFGLDDTSFQELETAVKILEAAETLKNSRIGIFGFPSRWLVNIPDFSRAEHLFGVAFVHVDLSQVAKECSTASCNMEFKFDTGKCTKEDLDKALKLFHAVKNIAARENLHALGIKCFDLIELLDTTGCVAVSLLNDYGIAAGCEADIPATLTMYIVQLLTQTPAFMANLCSVSEHDIILAHCTVATRLADPVVLTTHFESGIGVGIQGTLRKGPVTLAKLDAAFERMFLAEGKIAESGLTLPGLCRTQVKVTLKNANELLKMSLGNHLILSPGTHKQSLKEFCSRYGLDIVEI